MRILSATHKDLAALVEEGSFRQDLFYRINVIELKVPSLRERAQDIPMLAQHVLGKLGQQMDLQAPGLAEDALQALQRYDFPGNVRELENVLERALTLCEGETIRAADLHLREEDAAPLGLGAAAHDALPEGVALEDYLETVEKQAILDALEKTRHNKTQAAKLLGITFRALRYRLKKLGLE